MNMKIDIYPEACCEVCNETIHNHLDCPACGKKYASSANYHSLSENNPATITCECGAKFQTKDNPYDDDAEWDRIGLA